MATKLPEKYRKARNIQEGYEVCMFDADGKGKWFPVVRTLHILAPLKVSRLTLDTSVDPNRPADDGDTVICHPNDSVMSRRPAA